MPESMHDIHSTTPSQDETTTHNSEQDQRDFLDAMNAMDDMNTMDPEHFLDFGDQAEPPEYIPGALPTGELDETSIQQPAEKIKFYPGAAQIYGSGANFVDRFKRHADYVKYRADNIYWPFACKMEWEIAKLLYCSRLPRSKITNILKSEYVSHNIKTIEKPLPNSHTSVSTTAFILPDGRGTS
jgi:hypothetical protein